MSNKIPDEIIKRFAQDVLGCGCPERVFKKIETGEVSIGHQMGIAKRIVIGDTLLIYIVPEDSAESMLNGIEQVVAAGREDRDSNQYNRFRLVIPAIGDPKIETLLCSAFAEKAGVDEKLHIHIVEPGCLNGL